jgi:hypothetical protein
MKDFKKLIKEAHLGNPLNEIRTMPVSGTKAGVTYSLNSDRKLVLKKDVEGARIGDYVDITLPKGTVIYNLPGGVFAAHESLKRFATDFNPYYEKPTYSGISVIRSRDTLAAIEDAANLNENKLPDGFHSKEDLDQFLKDNPFDSERYKKLSIAQKQDILSYLNRDTEKEFERRMAMREEFSSTEQKMIKQIKSYKKRGSAMVTLPSKVRDFYFKNKEKIDALNENMGEWPKELTSRYSDEYRFELEKVMSDRAKYRVIDIESGELKGTPVFEKPESLMAYANDLIKPQGGTQSSHFGTNEGTCGYGEDGKVDPENTDKLKPAGPINEVESGDVVVYNDEEHTVQGIKNFEGDTMVSIRPNTLHWTGAKYEAFWVKPEDLKEDMNDPVLVKARAAKMAAEKEKAKQAELDKKYGSSFMDKLDAEINLKQELQNLKDEREEVLMRIEDIGVETEQTAEPEGGPIADELGERLMAAEKELRAIDSKIIDVKDELGYFRMYESVNEEYSDLDLYYRKGYKDFTGLVNRIVGEKDLEEKRKLMHVYINILPKASREKKFKLKQSINKMGPSQIDKFAYNILMRDSRMTSLEEDDEVNLNVSNANTKYAEEEDKVANSGAYESLQESLRKKLQDRLK